MEKDTGLPSRKDDHIEINLHKDVSSGLTTGLEFYRLEHQALPEMDLSGVETRSSFLNKTLSAPLLISSMTGGSETSARININLAQAAQAAGIAMGVGSQRAMLAHENLRYSYDIRKYAPDILLFANLGAVQLNYDYTQDDCQKAVDSIGADALILHLNPLQEALQPEGNTCFAGLLQKIEAVCRSLSVPVVVKEVGWGISEKTARRLLSAGVSAIDVAGAGGTSWSQVEMYRLSDERASIAAAFRNWGIPTADCLVCLHDRFPSLPLLASGGLRSGVDFAKCIALGASLCGMAGPFLSAAAISSESVANKIQLTIDELQIAMFAAGAENIFSLQNTPIIDIRKPSAL
jgi:isopentenyl-diphosphate delta-isomerase